MHQDAAVGPHLEDVLPLEQPAEHIMATEERNMDRVAFDDAELRQAAHATDGAPEPQVAAGVKGRRATDLREGALLADQGQAAA